MKEVASKAVCFKNELEKRYLTYALSTITSRSLPDLRDGLKPVHRRLLYAMLQLKLDPDKGFKKCARVVGDVIGKYHPHGEISVYDAMVRMAQDFAMRYPLVEGQGNFGSIDGDSQAAMRYTEARLTPYALMLLKWIDQDTVDFRENYDASDIEPIVLPAVLPNLLANGSEGIAVGMATYIPPHNLSELCEASLAILNGEQDIEKLLQIIPGPDLPTSGIVMEDPEMWRRIFETGKGSLKVRGKWHQEFLDSKNKEYQIVISEIPYQVSKKSLIERMAALYNEKKLPLIADFQDLSSEEIRIVVTPKNYSIDPNQIMHSLFSSTELEKKIYYNVNVLDKGLYPKTLGIADVLRLFLNFRKEVILKQSQHLLEKNLRRLEIIDGLLIVYLNLDELIKILREEDEPKSAMIAKWKLTDVQAESILNMRLRSIRKLEEVALQEERHELQKACDELRSIIDDPKQLHLRLTEEMQQAKIFADALPNGKRKTIFQAQEEAEVFKQALSEPVTVFYSHLGWIKAMLGHLEAFTYKNGDLEKAKFKIYSDSKLLCFTNFGKCYTVYVDKLCVNKAQGEPLRLMFELKPKEEIIMLQAFDPELKILAISSCAKGFVIKSEDLLSQTKNGKQILELDDGEESMFQAINGDSIAIVGENRRMLIFDTKDIPVMKKGRGAILQTLKGCKVAGVMIFNANEGLKWQHSGNWQSFENFKVWKGKRAGAGRIVFDKLWIDSK